MNDRLSIARLTPVVPLLFHRPLSMLLAHGFRNGFVVDGLLEPALGPAGSGDGTRWRDLPEVTPVLAVCMRADGPR